MPGMWDAVFLCGGSNLIALVPTAGATGDGDVPDQGMGLPWLSGCRRDPLPTRCWLVADPLLALSLSVARLHPPQACRRRRCTSLMLAPPPTVRWPW